LVVALLVAAGCGSSDDDLGVSSDAPSATTAPADFEPGELAQDWWRHGAGLTVHADGSFELTYRTYRDCAVDPAPCDELTGDEIRNGGHLAGAFDGGAGPVWTGTITDSVEPEVWPPGSVEATYDPATDTLDLRSTEAEREPWTFCGDQSGDHPDPRCGA
jgi:hypothetical protein